MKIKSSDLKINKFECKTFNLLYPTLIINLRLIVVVVGVVVVSVVFSVVFVVAVVVVVVAVVVVVVVVVGMFSQLLPVY